MCLKMGAMSQNGSHLFYEHLDLVFDKEGKPNVVWAFRNVETMPVRTRMGELVLGQWQCGNDNE
jgi:hypothetical protein